MDFDVGEAGIGFADIDKAALVAHGEGVIGKQTSALAMAVLGDGDDNVEGGKGALELHPKLAAPAGNVGRLGCFCEQALVASFEGEEEAIFDFFDGVAEFRAGELEAGLLGGGEQAFEKQAALGEWGFEKGAAIEEEQVESDEADGDLGGCEEIDLFAAEALLELGEGDSAAVAPTDDFAVEDEITGDVADGVEELWEFCDAVERA